MPKTVGILAPSNLQWVNAPLILTGVGWIKGNPALLAAEATSDETAAPTPDRDDSNAAEEEEEEVAIEVMG
jgi:hypothetical protein